MVDSLGVLGGLMIAGGLFAFAAISRREGEARATQVAALMGLGVATLFLLAGSLPDRAGIVAPLVLLALLVLAVVVLLSPSAATPQSAPDPGGRIDERDIMFSRARLQPGTERFEAHYRNRPEHREPDERFRSEPGLLREGALHHDPAHFAAADASFDTVELLQSRVEGEPAPERVTLEPTDLAAFLQNWIRKLGAVSVGITPTRDHHYYTHVGRGPDWGRPISREHPRAIAFTVEMDREMVDRSPRGPIVMESAHQYLASGAIAIQVAQFIRRLGYRARAHIDGNYRVVCPLVARDAGLGEIGRMGLLMTPELGPRVRIAVVTTDLPLPATPERRVPGMLEFCAACKKCADACPARAIPSDGPREIDGTSRWQIDSEACFTLWCKVGTDCGRCVKVCPYAHARGPAHDLVRRGMQRSARFRRAALALDDLFYGRIPPARALEDWMRVRPVTDPREAYPGINERGPDRNPEPR